MTAYHRETSASPAATPPPAASAPAPAAAPAPSPTPTTVPQSQFVCDLRSMPAMSSLLVAPMFPVGGSPGPIKDPDSVIEPCPPNIQGITVPDRTPDDVLRLVQDEGVDIIDFRFCDLPGLMQHFSMPAHELTGHMLRWVVETVSAREGAPPGHLVLTHLVPWNDRARTGEEASGVPFGGRVSLATQGQVFELG